MSTFRTEQDLRHALSEARLDSLADRIVATMRPAIQFVRRQQPDDALPPGTSKIGGLPDLPPGFAWPHRRSPVDADTQIRALREQRIRDRERSASSRSQRPSDDILALLSEHERDAWLRSIEANRPDPDKLTAIHAQEDRYDDLMVVALGCEFPLAFLAQINLGALSNESGFDRDFPRRGVFSLFEDLTARDGDGSFQLHWFDVTTETLERRAPPATLIELSDARQPDFPWHEQTMAEVLQPHSTLVVPFHWIEAVGPERDAVFDFLHRPVGGYFPQPDVVEGEQAGNFGDFLGGWPKPIQGDPERMFIGDARSFLSPGDDRIRHLFSWGGEYYAGTRRMHAPYGGDGTTYLMIQRDDLLSRRFDKAQSLYQCD
jgi:uncharacterized protein YwqG